MAAPRDRKDVTYFGAGPALLPSEVLEKAARALVNYHGTGIGLAEHSHRSAYANTILDDTRSDLIKFLGIPRQKYEVLFMQGGGTGQFAATALNLVGSWVRRRHEELQGDEDAEHLNQPARMQRLRAALDNDLKLDYIVTGGWSQKAAAEAVRLLGSDRVNIVTDARQHNDGKYGLIPDESTWTLSKDPAMVYYCDNETVDGVEFPDFPSVLEPGLDGAGPIVVADMSSNILSRRVPITKFGAIFFGAQKNLGVAGITVVVIRKDLLPQPSTTMMRQLGLPLAPSILQYETIAKNHSLYNTLSIFDVYIAGLVLRKLLATFPDKVAGQEALSATKAKLIYDALDAYPEVYKVVPDRSVRSRMNICFRIVKPNAGDEEEEEQAEKAFLSQADAQGLAGLKGHRSVGGVRASNYNSISLEGAERLALFIERYARS
ncbi:hypothetical protein L249_5717 [Ophiocordyceps polyrhachis-furcata BCC 54312]|uniref:phosphoserine transaminase n=1 Tax=Ophiocordyceps polyrhachis-furcata BCC 54312 TaxID=1330021 RepID=A0A367KZV3_9HYPO|nr:hypothetical protein L249_5717 [Ophiocordyceps polyrhachis-furcata BCC 54312]